MMCRGGMRMVHHVRVCGRLMVTIMRHRGRMVISHSGLVVVRCMMLRVGRIGWGRMVGLRMMITVMRLSIMHWFVMVGRSMVHWFVMVSSGGMMVGHTRCVVWRMIGHRMRSIGGSLE